MRLAFLLAAFIAGVLQTSALPAHAQGAQSEGAPSDVVATALKFAGNTDGVFTAGAEAILHVQSGLHCPAYVGNAYLSHAFVFDSPAGRGFDVGCDYGRRSAPGSDEAIAKHTVYAVKRTAGETIDAVFARYQKEMHGSVPSDASSGRASLIMTNPPTGFPEFRSEETFYAGRSGRKWQTEVLVAFQGDWIIEVRSTRHSQYHVANDEEAADQIVGTMLFFQAISDLGGTSYRPSYSTQKRGGELTPVPQQ